LLGLTTGSVEEAAFDSGLKVVTEDAVTWLEHSSFEISNSVRILGGGSGVVWSAGLLTVLAGGAFRMTGTCAPDEAQSKLVQESTNCQLLDMGE